MLTSGHGGKLDGEKRVDLQLRSYSAVGEIHGGEARDEGLAGCAFGCEVFVNDVTSNDRDQTS